MAFDMPRRMVRIASPNAAIPGKLEFARVSHSGRHRDHSRLFGLRIKSHHRVAAGAAYPNLATPPIDVDGVRNIVSLARERIDFPKVFLWVVAAEVAASKTGDPYDPVVGNLEAPRTVYRRLPFGDLVRRRVDHSDSLTVELRVPDLTVRPNVDAVGSYPPGFAHRRHIRCLLGFQQLILL